MPSAFWYNAGMLYRRRRKNNIPKILTVIILLVATGLVLWNLPGVQYRFGWRLDAGMSAARSLLQPFGSLPTPVKAESSSETPQPTLTPRQPTSTDEPVSLPAPAPTALPSRVLLPAPQYEAQDWNNCGPAALAMTLRTFGWQGDQFDIASMVRVHREDRNVNVFELVYYVNNNVGWLRSLYRAGGDIDLVRRFLAAGIPVLTEEGFYHDEKLWYQDDGWLGHYLLVTGYDDMTRTFLVQNSFIGADQWVAYEAFDRNWQTFNRMYLLVYTPEQEATVRSLLGNHWDLDYNRQHAFEIARQESERQPENPFARFNMGTNLVYFERYVEATQAYDTARHLGLPQRMLRYQFGPFLAYFHSGQNDDLMVLTEYALRITPNSEEALLWRGWGLFREGSHEEARRHFQMALEARPNYIDAQYALDYLRNN